MNFSEALDFIHATSWQGSRLGLARIEELMALLGNPQKQLRFIHVAGTNGKGSVCAMLSEILPGQDTRQDFILPPPFRVTSDEGGWRGHFR